MRASGVKYCPPYSAYVLLKPSSLASGTCQPWCLVHQNVCISSDSHLRDVQNQEATSSRPDQRLDQHLGPVSQRPAVRYRKAHPGTWSQKEAVKWTLGLQKLPLYFQANGITANLPPSSAPSSMSPGGMGSAGVGVNMSPGLVMLEEGKPDTSVAYKQWLYGLDLCEFMFHDGLLDRLVGSFFIFYLLLCLHVAKQEEAPSETITSGPRIISLPTRVFLFNFPSCSTNGQNRRTTWKQMNKMHVNCICPESVGWNIKYEEAYSSWFYSHDISRNLQFVLQSSF